MKERKDPTALSKSISYLQNMATLPSGEKCEKFDKKFPTQQGHIFNTFQHFVTKRFNLTMISLSLVVNFY